MLMINCLENFPCCRSDIRVMPSLASSKGPASAEKNSWERGSVAQSFLFSIKSMYLCLDPIFTQIALESHAPSESLLPVDGAKDDPELKLSINNNN